MADRISDNRIKRHRALRRISVWFFDGGVAHGRVVHTAELTVKIMILLAGKEYVEFVVVNCTTSTAPGVYLGTKINICMLYG